MHHLLYTVTNSGKQDRNEAYWNIPHFFFGTAGTFLISQNHLRILLFGTYFRLWSLAHKNTHLSFSLTLKKYNLKKLWYFKHQKQPTFPWVYSKQGSLFLSSETGARSITPFKIKSGHTHNKVSIATYLTVCVGYIAICSQLGAVSDFILSHNWCFKYNVGVAVLRALQAVCRSMLIGRMTRWDTNLFCAS